MLVNNSTLAIQHNSPLKPYYLSNIRITEDPDADKYKYIISEDGKQLGLANSIEKANELADSMRHRKPVILNGSTYRVSYADKSILFYPSEKDAEHCAQLVEMDRLKVIDRPFKDCYPGFKFDLPSTARCIIWHNKFVNRDEGYQVTDGDYEDIDIFSNLEEAKLAAANHLKTLPQIKVDKIYMPPFFEYNPNRACDLADSIVDTSIYLAKRNTATSDDRFFKGDCMGIAMFEGLLTHKECHGYGAFEDAVKKIFGDIDLDDVQKGLLSGFMSGFERVVSSCQRNLKEYNPTKIIYEKAVMADRYLAETAQIN